MSGYYSPCCSMVQWRYHVKLERRIRRRLKRKWRRSGLLEDRIRFIEQNRIVYQLLFSARSQYYTKLIYATIRHELEPNSKRSIHSFEEASVATTKRHRFSCPPHSPLLKISRSLASKSCELDPVPFSIMLDCLDLLCPVIWKIVYLSLETSVIPTKLKQAVICPMLKKPGLDHQH